MLVFLANFVWSLRLRARSGRAEPVGLEVDRVAAAVAGAGAQLRPHPDVRRRSVPVRRSRRRRPPRVAHRAGEADAHDRARQHTRPTTASSSASRRRCMARNLRVAAHLWSGATAFFFAAFLFAYFYLRSLDNVGDLAAEARRSVVDARHARDGRARRERSRRCGSGSRDHRAERRPAWRIKGAVALALGCSPRSCCRSSSGRRRASGRRTAAYASVYLGWTGLLTLFVVGLAVLARDTLAISIRYRRHERRDPLPEGHGSGDADRPSPTSTTRSRSSGRSSRRCRSTRCSSPGSASSPGSSSTSSSAMGFLLRSSNWPLDWPLVAIVVAALLYVARRPPERDRERRRRSGGAALRSTPGSRRSRSRSPRRSTPTPSRLFWVHMVQHVLLMMVAPPLLAARPPVAAALAAAAARRSPAARASASLAGAGARSGRGASRAGSRRRCRRSSLFNGDAARLARAGALRPDAARRPGPRPRARALLRHGTALLGAPRCPAPPASAARPTLRARSTRRRRCSSAGCSRSCSGSHRRRCTAPTRRSRSGRAGSPRSATSSSPPA